MEGRPVAVESVVVAVTRGEMDAAPDLLIEQGVVHRAVDVRIYTDGEFTDEAGALIDIENGIDPVVIIG